MKYKAAFMRDVKWYLAMRHQFNFDGCSEYYNKLGKKIIQADKKGVDGIASFYFFDSNGVVKPTKHPNILHTLLKVKGSVNLHIKMYAEDRANGLLCKDELIEMCKEFNAPKWFYNAVENQKVKLWK